MAIGRKQNNNSTLHSYLKGWIDFGGRFINYRMGIYGAAFLGIVVFIINFSATQAWIPSLTAALKQGSYTFLFGGIIMKFCEFLAVNIKRQTLALGAATLIPSAIAITLTFAVHNLRGTPRPLASTIPTLLIIPATAVVGYRKRKAKIKGASPFGAKINDDEMNRE